MGTGVLSSRIKRTGREACYSPPCTSELRNEWSFNSTLRLSLHGKHRDLMSNTNELHFIVPAPGFAELHFSAAADPVPESLGNRVISTTERNLYRECLMSSSGMSSGISSTNTVKVFCGRQGIGTWNERACVSLWTKVYVLSTRGQQMLNWDSCPETESFRRRPHQWKNLTT